MRKILISIKNSVLIYTQETRESLQTKLPYKFYFLLSKYYTEHFYLCIITVLKLRGFYFIAGLEDSKDRK